MLLTTVVIILQEVLEASLIISILMVFDSQLGQRRSWLHWAFGLGIVGALIYALNLSRVSAWFDYTGQEVVNALLQLGIYGSLLLVIVLPLLRFREQRGAAGASLVIAMKIMAVCLAFTREGSEVFIYVSAFTGDMERLVPVLVGSFIGAGIGISAGAIFYYWLYSLKQRHLSWISRAALALVAGNMLAQAATLLIQADILPSQAALWDTSGWVREDSLLGQLLYAIAGYEATPTLLQASAYFGGIGLIAVAAYIARWSDKQTPHRDMP